MTAEELSTRQKSINDAFESKSKAADDVFKADTAAARDEVNRFKDRLVELQKDLADNIEKRVSEIYTTFGGILREPKFVRPNLTLYMETVTQKDPSSTVSGSPYNLLNITNGSYLNTLKNQIGFAPFDKHSGMEKTICRIHIYDESASANPRKQLIQTIMSEGSRNRLITKDGKKNVNDIMKEYGLNTSKKIRQFIKNSYPSITYGANNSTVHGISITSNVSDQVSQVIQISSYAKRNNPQSSANDVTDYDEITVVPASINLRMMGNPFISRGNEIYIDFGTNTTLDNIYTVKNVSHNISNGKFETSIGLIYSGQGDTKSVAGDIKRVIEKIKTKE